MGQAGMGRARVVVCASQCWDARLREALWVSGGAVATDRRGQGPGLHPGESDTDAGRV